MENCIISHPTTDESASTGSAADFHQWDGYCQVSAPAKKHLINFLDHFKDVVERYGCKSDLGGFSSLLQLSAFQMGKLAIEFDEEEFEDFFEDFYDLLPQHIWRYTLFSHLIHLVIKYIPLDYLLPALADICIENESFHHAFEIMKAFWTITGPVSKQEYSWALSKMKVMGYRNSWMRFLAEYTIDYYHEKEFLFESMDVEGSGLAIAKIIICDYRNYDYKKTAMAVDYLVKHCCLKTHIWYKDNDCFCFDLLTKESKFLLQLDLSNLDPLILFSLFITGLMSYEQEDEEKLIQKLDEFSDFSDIRLALKPFSLDQIHSLSMKAKEYGHGNLSTRLLVYLVNFLRLILRQNGAGDEEFLKKCEADLLQVQEQLKPDVTWRYEVIADEWISNTPKKLKKHVFIRDSNPMGETPVHINGSLHRPSPLAPSSTIIKTPFRKFNRKLDILRSGTDDDPITALLSVERIRRALNEKQRMKEAYKLASTPNALDKKSIHLNAASPVIQESPMASRPPLGINMQLPKSNRNKIDIPHSCIQATKRVRTLFNEDENYPIPHNNNLESSDPIAQNMKSSIHTIPDSPSFPRNSALETDIVQSEDDLLS